jgi:hypothetical protein
MAQIAGGAEVQESIADAAIEGNPGVAQWTERDRDRTSVRGNPYPRVGFESPKALRRFVKQKGRIEVIRPFHLRRS